MPPCKFSRAVATIEVVDDQFDRLLNLLVTWIHGIDAGTDPPYGVANEILLERKAL
jgi:hypothetical protein